jgi:hypothetical protein
MSSTSVDVRQADAPTPADLFRGLRLLAGLGVDDPYVPAKLCRGGTVKTHSALLALLARRPDIGRRRPGPRRLEVNICDFLSYLESVGDALAATDLPGDLEERIAAAQAEVDRRRAEIDARKGR